MGGRPLYAHWPSLLAEVHNKLGWDDFVEGRISKLFMEVEKAGLDSHCSGMTSERWCTTLDSKLLQLTHKQWLFLNLHVYSNKLDGISQREHDEIFERVKELMLTDPAELLTKHRYLLKEDFEQLGEELNGVRQQWISSMESGGDAADYIRSGNKYWGTWYIRLPVIPGTLLPL